MANGRAATAARRDPSSTTTREDAVNVWGRTIASQIAKGDSIFQKSHNLLPPRTLPMRDSTPSTGGRPIAPMRFHGSNAIILRTVSVQRGYADPTFALERTARTFNAQHGDQVRPLRTGAQRVEVPNAARADEPRRTRRDVKLAADGPNFDEFGRQVEGKKGDTARDEKGQIKTELVDVEGMRRAPGVRVYYHRDDLNVPSLAARPLPSERAPDNVLASTVGSARRVHGLKVEETPDMAGRAALVLQPKGTEVDGEKLKQDRYTLSVGTADSFASKEHHITAIVHEVSRFSMCRDGNKDAIAVAKAPNDPAVREKMPEFGRSELVASAATMEKVTSAGMTWHPPVYQREHIRDIRSAQTKALREPGGLDTVGSQAHRTERMNDNREATAFGQRERNQQRRDAAPSVEQAARGFATRGARPMQRAEPAGKDAPDKAQPARATSRASASTPATPGKPRATRTRAATRAKPPAQAPPAAAGAAAAKAGRGRAGSQSQGDDKPAR